MNYNLVVLSLITVALFVFVYLMMRLRMYKIENDLGKVRDKANTAIVRSEDYRSELEKMILRRDDAHQRELSKQAMRLVEVETHVANQTTMFSELKSMFETLNDKLDELKSDKFKRT